MDRLRFTMAFALIWTALVAAAVATGKTDERNLLFVPASTICLPPGPPLVGKPRHQYDYQPGGARRGSVA